MGSAQAGILIVGKCFRLNYTAILCRLLLAQTKQITLFEPIAGKSHPVIRKENAAWRESFGNRSFDSLLLFENPVQRTHWLTKANYCHMSQLAIYSFRVSKSTEPWRTFKRSNHYVKRTVFQAFKVACSATWRFQIVHRSWCAAQTGYAFNKNINYSLIDLISEILCKYCSGHITACFSYSLCSQLTGFVRFKFSFVFSVVIRPN